jgi:hypothetical protein
MPAFSWVSWKTSLIGLRGKGVSSGRSAGYEEIFTVIPGDEKDEMYREEYYSIVLVQLQ